MAVKLERGLVITMQYQALEELPAGLQRTLPVRAQKIYQDAYNIAWKTNANSLNPTEGSREEIAHRAGWSAVKSKYHQSFNSTWRRKGES